jgi:hypothetical protein
MATVRAQHQSPRTGLAEPINPAGSFQEKIERVAYGLYEQRGRIDGHDWEDWLEAERIVKQQREARL